MTCDKLSNQNTNFSKLLCNIVEFCEWEYFEYILNYILLFLMFFYEFLCLKKSRKKTVLYVECRKEGMGGTKVEEGGVGVVD